MRINKLAITLLLALPHGYSIAADNTIETLVVTVSRNAQPVQEIVGNTAVLDRKSLELISHNHIQESMLRIPGANMARGNGQEYLPALRSPVLTGAGACGGVLAAIDGIPLRASGFCNLNELFDSHSEIADRIEVVRGPGSALFGSNAMHGIINVITPSVNSGTPFLIGLEGGPHDYSRVRLTANKETGAQGLRADLTISHDGGYRDDSGYDQQKLTLRHEYNANKLSVTTLLAATNLNQETAGYIEGENAYKDGSLRDSNPNPEAYRDSYSMRLYSRFNYQMSDTQSVSVTPYLRYMDMDFLQHFLPGDPLEQNGQKSFGIQSAYYSDVTENFNLVAGFDFEYTDAYLKQSQDAPTQGSLFLQTTIPEGKHYDYDVEALVAAPFFQMNWNIYDRITLTAGLRYEFSEYDYDNRMLDGRTDESGVICGMGGCRYNRPGDRKDRFENWSPKLGLLYRLTDKQQLYLNLAQGFRAPQATELYRLQREQSRANLDSVELTSAELGWRNQGDRFHYEVVLFWMKKRNVIFRDSDFFNVADGETRHSGVEFSALYELGAQWDLTMTTSFAEHEYKDNRVIGGVEIDGNDVDSAPHHFGSLQLGWNFSSRGRSELEWVHQGAYYTDPENQHRYEGHDLLNLRAIWQVNDHWKLSARVLNLTNQEYAERADYTAFSGDRYFPGEPLSLYMGVDFKW